MKPPPFEYSRPESVADALATLSELGTEAKVLAGGQSLLPILAMRLAAPRHLVDINQLRELAYVRVDTDVVRVGALARHSSVLADEAAFQAQPMLRSALRFVAHATIRNRGTTLGSIVHADPAGEMPAVLALLGGSVRVAGRDGEREVAASEFFLGPLESAVQPGELAIEAHVPALGPRAGCAFLEIARRHGDYAMCGVGALVELADGGDVSAARAGYLSMGSTPVVLDLTASVTAGNEFAAAAKSAAEQLEPEADIHASADYRRHLAGVLTRRALRSAYEHARSRSRPAASTAKGPGRGTRRSAR